MESLESHLPRFNRAENPPGMRFQTRDEDILNSIYEYSGVLAKRQLKEMFWPDSTCRAMEKRLSKLYHNGYIDWPNHEQRRTAPIPEPVCWLGWRGALFISGLFDVRVPLPSSDNENQLRLLQKNLHNQGINWVREPRWSLLKHDLEVIDFKLAVEDEVTNSPGFILENWKYETEFRSDPDVVSYSAKDRNGDFRQLKKRVLPDSYFEIVDEERRKKGEAHRVRFLMELDMSTHDNPSFGREKVAPGVAYIKSAAYKSRFGYNSGRWLVVTNGGQIRLRNLMVQTKETAGQDSSLFFFTSIKDIENGNPITSPIWRQIGREEARPLLILEK